MTNNNAMVYDFETLSQDPTNGVVISFAMLMFNEDRFLDNPYTYEELLSETKYIKFNVEEQVKKYNLSIEKATLDWWSQQNETAKKQLVPRATDVSIDELYSFVQTNAASEVPLKKVYTRRNTFDPVFMTSIMKTTGNPLPYDWWLVRDTISTIDGLSWGSGISDKFYPDGLYDSFVHHDPRHDIVMDVMRLQTLVQAIQG